MLSSLVSLMALALFLLLPLVVSSSTMTATDSALNSSAVNPSPGRIRWAYHVSYSPSSLASLRQHIGSLDYLSPYWYVIDGSAQLKRVGEASDAEVAEVVGLAGSHGVRLLPMVKNSATYADFHSVLADASLRQKAIAQMVDLVTQDGYDGIHIDFEALNAADRPHLSAFMAELAAQLRPQGKLVTQALPAKDQERSEGWAGAYDYAALASSNDLLVLMAYGYGTSVPQSTAPFAWVERSTAFAASQIPPGKLILGMPWYGYDWNVTTDKLVSSLTYAEAMDIVQRTGATLLYDQGVQGAHFVYFDNGQKHEVWFENGRSQDAKLDLVEKYGLAGASGWRLGHEDPAVWPSLDARLGFRTWYLAEGSTGYPYHTWVLLMNPNSSPAKATVTFMREDGSTVAQQYNLPPTSRTNVFANQVVPNAAVSTKVEADKPIFVERAMYFGHDGHASAGVTSARYRWYLPEGYTGPGTDTWILVMNPGSSSAQATVTFMVEGGPPVVRRYDLGPTSRLNIWADQVVPGASFSTLVEADQPVVAERASYFDGGKGGHGSVGVPYAARRWYLAEGYTGYQDWVLLMNPNAESAQATLTFLTEAGDAFQQSLSLPPTSRSTVNVNTILPAGIAFSTRVEADRPIVAERAMYWAAGSSGHAALGVSAPARTWYLAEGSTAAPFEEWVLVLNPNSQPTWVEVTFMLEGGSTVERRYQVAAGSRFTIHADEVIPEAAVSVRVESELAVVVERSMYFGSGGHNGVGIGQ